MKIVNAIIEETENLFDAPGLPYICIGILGCSILLYPPLAVLPTLVAGMKLILDDDDDNDKQKEPEKAPEKKDERQLELPLS